MVKRAGFRCALAACALVCASAQAQEASLEASVDRATLRENESFTYSLRAEGHVRGEPDTSPLEQEFDVLSRSSNSRIQIIDGRTEQVVEWVFQLMPRGVGEFTVPPLEVGSLASNPVELEVLPAVADSGGPGDIFMEIEADPDTAYVQAQVLFTLRLFVGVSISSGRATLTPPEISGGEAIIERLGERQYQTERDGRTFIVRERQYAVFPQHSGELTIGPATFEAMVIPTRGMSRVRRLQSESLQIDVRRAVSPPPEYPAASWLPATKLTLDDSLSDIDEPFTLGIPRTRTLTVKADGVLETQLPELELEQTDGIRQYPDQPELDRTTTELGLSVERAERYAVIAQQDGEIELGGVELPWFNVVDERWEVARIEPRRLEVSRGIQLPDTPAAPGAETGQQDAQAPAAEPDGFWRAVSAVFAAGWLLTLVLWGQNAVRRRRPAPSRPTSTRRLLKRLRSACRASDPVEAQRLLLEWAALKFPEAPPATLGALASVLPDRLGARVRELEAHLYGKQSQPWNGARLDEALAHIDPAGRAAGRNASDDPLRPLYR